MTRSKICLPIFRPVCCFNLVAEICAGLDSFSRRTRAGLIPILLDILTASNQQGISKEAMLCHDGICHIKGVWGYDLGRLAIFSNLQNWLIR